MGSQIHFRFDRDKAIESLLYIANRIPRPEIYNIMKIAYFADKRHLARYGRFIFGDQYCALPHGPVPSGAYDICKEARNVNSTGIGFRVGKRTVTPLRDSNVRLLSRSDILCLDESISLYDSLTFDQLKKESHDAAYDKTPKNGPISIENIIAETSDAADLLAHLKERHSA